MRGTTKISNKTLKTQMNGRKVLKWILNLKKRKRIPSIFKDESTGSCICLWKLAVAVATYVIHAK
jgi:hypothetical protein